MVLQKRLNYGFSGYQVPPTPRATRSARRRCSFKKKVDDNQLCAFDLLATVAGKLLLEGENSPCSTDILTEKEESEVLKDSVKKEQQDEDKFLSVEPCDKGSCYRNFYSPEIDSRAPVVKHCFNEYPHAHNDTCSGLASVLTTSDCSEKVGSAEKLVNSENKVEPGGFINKVDVDSSGYRVSNSFRLEDESKKEVKIEPPNSDKVSVSNRADMCSLEGPAVWDRKPPALLSLDNNVKFPLYGEHVPCGSFPVCRDDVKLATRDDDENSSGCTQPSTMNKACRPSQCIGDRRIRNLLASKYWKVTSKSNEEENISADLETKPVYHNKKNFHKCQRSLRDYPFKKRKLYDCGSVSNSDGGISSDGISSSSGKRFNDDGFSLGTTTTGTSSNAPGQHASFQSRDSHVKLKIKSFRVPELFIEIPETATVGSLKRAVMEAVTAILSGGLRVGVLLQGKKIRDDNKTLLQTGISHDKKLDALGFTLEPNSSQAPPPLCCEDHPCLLPCDSSQPKKRYPPTPNSIQRGTSDASPEPLVPNFCNFIESDHDSAPSPPDLSLDKSGTDSRALVVVPPRNVEALAAVPMRKSKRSDAVQRRIRRPFSVSEVEALVQVVEKLGTGRWRDVKLRAFDNAKHRTYVDLKDKWKTLVHTARISPQQRRGEPVPQELLDRVLTAHAYWSELQVKQQLKQQPDTCLLL